MKFLVVSLAAFIFTSYQAHADIALGVFKGTDKSGAACEIEVLVKYYTDNIKHPLNERVTVNFEGLNWDLSHPAVVDKAEGKVRFDHGYFHQVVATPDGAQYLVMNIDHDAEPHPATSFTFIDDHYRDAAKSRKVVCEGLVKQ